LIDSAFIESVLKFDMQFCFDFTIYYKIDFPLSTPVCSDARTTIVIV
jgi:hypothetical protein